MRTAAAFLLSAVMVCTLAVTASASSGTYYSKPADKGTKSYNMKTDGYTGVSSGWTWSDCYHAFTVNSNLFEYNGNLYRLEYTGNNLLLEKYSPDLKYVGRNFIKMELPIFGGFYAGEEYNYIVFGKENPNESKSAEVLRVVKYTKGMKRVSSLSLYGCNTYIPFDAGSLRMDEADGTLFIHTCKEMFSKGDGVHHQANMSYYIRTSDMKIIRAEYEVLWGIAYSSHSFNQFVKYKDGVVYSLSHGDAYPRSVVLFETIGYNSGNARITETDLLKIKGDTGNNYTGLILGGMEISNKYVLVTGATVPQDSTWGNTKQKNVFLIKAPLSAPSKASINYFTSYSEGAGITMSEPKLTKINDDSFMMMWTETKDKTTKLYVTMIDGNGDKKGKTYVFKDAYLSDCQPIVYNGQVVYYVTRGGKPTFYFFNTDGDFKAQKAAYNKKK